MFSDLIGIGRAYKKLPPHHNFTELAKNIEKLADYLLDRGAGSFGSQGHLKAPDRWEWQLGNDLKMLIEYAKDFVPPDTDGLHHYSRHGKRRPGASSPAAHR
jgi:hypothetical protein